MTNYLTSKSYVTTSITVFVLLLIALSEVGRATAIDDRAILAKHTSTPRIASDGPDDPAELEAFLDMLIGGYMEEQHLAGAAVSVVKGGKLLTAKGYGFADIENGVPVDAEQTIFRIGSVGKVFTWTAVMQLVEQGDLDLDADINTYLDFRVPDTYPQPITLKNLMTHTSGFEDKLLGSGVTDPGDFEPVRDFLVSYMPARVRPPGYAGYANFNAMLAGYIVARASGLPYEQYIEERIFEPLGMAHSTVHSPMPDELRPLASVGYTYADGAFHVFPDYMAQPAGLPSGMHQATVTDMARFMIAHLQGGRYSDADMPEARILSEDVMHQMHSTLYTPDPRLRGTAYGLFDWTDNGQRTLGHEGYGPPMHSVLMLLPDQEVGVFLTYNSKGTGGLTAQHTGFQRAFFDHYYAAPAVEPIEPPADFAERASRFVGSYRYASSPSTTLMKLVELGGGFVTHISNPGDGTLRFVIEGTEVPFVEVEPLFFRSAEGPWFAVFGEDDRGRITHMVTDYVPQYATVRLRWYESPSFNMALLLVCILVFLTTIPVVLARAMLNRRAKGQRRLAPGGASATPWMLLLISVLNLLVVIATVWSMFYGTPNELMDVHVVLKLGLGLGVVSTALTVGVLFYMVLAWTRPYWGMVARSYYTVVTAAAVAFVWFLNYWNLLGWRY